MDVWVGCSSLYRIISLSPGVVAALPTTPNVLPSNRGLANKRPNPKRETAPATVSDNIGYLQRATCQSLASPYRLVSQQLARPRPSPSCPSRPRTRSQSPPPRLGFPRLYRLISHLFRSAPLRLRLVPRAACSDIDAHINPPHLTIAWQKMPTQPPPKARISGKMPLTQRVGQIFSGFIDVWEN